MTVIPLSNLVFSLIPVALTLAVMFAWSIDTKKTLYAVVRMVVQLMLIGFALDTIFTASNHWVLIAVLSVMLLAASWISLKSMPIQTSHYFAIIFVSITLSGVFTLLIITQLVMNIDTLFDAKIMIPIAGMIFSNNMNIISLAGDRFYSEIEHHPIQQARNTAFQTALIPITNSLFAVGLVSLPGMMTGQILSGVEPLIAVRYQIMVMSMILGSGGLTAAVFLHLVIKKQHLKNFSVE